MPFIGPEVYVRRLDLIHPEIQGNKWFKLKYNIEKVLSTGHRTMLTFGGPYSNHLYATASAGAEFGFRTIGIVRGEEPRERSATLRFAESKGMNLVFITREAYARKEEEDMRAWLQEELGAFYLVPEGGSNFLGINGCMEILTEDDRTTYPLVACACGTGATAAGLALSMGQDQQLLAFSVTGPATSLFELIRDQLWNYLGDEEVADEYMKRIHVVTGFEFGGYARWNEALIDFIRQAGREGSIPLDQVYTGKMFYGLREKLQQGMWAGERILALHTGGLQGRLPFLDLSQE